MDMTKAELVRICKATGGYNDPKLNDQLLLHCKGFNKIQCLEDYVNVRALWLEQNALSKIEGLEANTDLRTLYLHENFLHAIENIDHLTQLHTLNVSNNRIPKLSGLAGLEQLETLLATHNKFKSLDSIAHVHEVPQLQCLDLSHCNIDLQEGETEEDLISFFEKMPNLSVLYLIGNPCLNKVRYYRKKMLSRLPTLTYLDDKPVFDNERRLVAAWHRGGAEAENAEREAIAEEKRLEMKRDLDHWAQLQAKGRPLKEEREKEWAVQMEQKKADDEVRRTERREAQQRMVAEEERARSDIDVQEYRATTALMQEWARVAVRCGVKKTKHEVWGAPDYDLSDEDGSDGQDAETPAHNDEGGAAASPKKTSAADSALDALVAAKVGAAQEQQQQEAAERELWLEEMDDVQAAVRAAASQKEVSQMDKEAAVAVQEKGPGAMNNVWASYMQWEQRGNKAAASAWD